MQKPRSFARFSAFPLLFVLAACGGTTAPAAPAASPSATPATPGVVAAPASANPEIASLVAREATDLKKLHADAAEESPGFTIEAASAPSFEMKDDVLHVTIPIGTREPVRCLLRDDAIATATLLHGVIGSMKKDLPKSAMSQLDVGIAGHVPYILTEMQYLTEDQGKQALGTLKMIAFERLDDTLLCMHDELGYRATFRRIAEGLATSLAFADDEQEETPTELEISIARIGKQRIGFDIEKHWAQDGGTHEEVGSLALLIPKGEGELSSYVVRRGFTSAKDGLVTKIQTASEENGALERSLTVQRTPAGKYHVEGLIGEKETKGDFTSKKPILARWRERNEIRDKMLGGPKARELTFFGYSPSDDPVGATTGIWRATSEPKVFDTVLGKLEVRQTVDADAHETVGVAKLAPEVEMTLERVVFVPHAGTTKKVDPKKGTATKADAKANPKADPKKGAAPKQ